MSKPGDQVSAASSSASGPARQHQSHPEETEEELREHQGLCLSSSMLEQELGHLRGLVIKQEPQDPQDQDRQVEQEFLFRQVRMRGGAEEKTTQGREAGRGKMLHR